MPSLHAILLQKGKGQEKERSSHPRLLIITSQAFFHSCLCGPQTEHNLIKICMPEIRTVLNNTAYSLKKKNY